MKPESPQREPMKPSKSAEQSPPKKDDHPSLEDGPSKGGSLKYYFLSFLFIHFWLLYYLRSYLKGELEWLCYQNGLDMISYLLQQVFLLCGLALLGSVVSNKKIHFLIGGVIFLYGSLVFFDSVLLSYTSLCLFDSLPMLYKGGSFFKTLQEAGLLKGEGGALLFLSGVMFLLGGMLHRKFPLGETSVKFKKTLLALGLASGMLFLSEQIYSRNFPPYLFRKSFYPLYLQIFSTNGTSEVISLAPQPDRETLLNKVRENKRGPNIVFFLLESFRGDTINPKITPALSRMSQESLFCRKAYTGAIFTPMAWNILFTDYPDYSIRTIGRDQKEMTAIVPMNLLVLQRAGYHLNFSISTNFRWKGMYQRLFGKEKIFSQYYCAYKGTEDNRHRSDEEATKKVLQWIGDGALKKPYFLLLQLDGTHYTYYFDKESAVVTPYSREVLPWELGTREELALLYNRYLNSAHQVDGQIKRVVQLFQKQGEYKDTIFIVMADHGESFQPKYVAHLLLNEATKRIPLLLKLPGRGFQSVPEGVSTIDVFPTLFDYLKIWKGTPPQFLGQSILSLQGKNRPILVFQGNGLAADLKIQSLTLHFKTLVASDQIIFTPASASKGDRRLLNPMAFFEGIPWRKILAEVLSRGR